MPPFFSRRTETGNPIRDRLGTLETEHARVTKSLVDLAEDVAGEGEARTEEPQATPTESWSEPASYVVPPKRRTTPKVAQLRREFRSRLLQTIDEADQWSSAEADKQELLRERLQALLQAEDADLSASEKHELEETLLADLLGFGAVEGLVHDKTVSEIMVNGPDVVFAEQKGKLTETEVVFDDEEHLQWTAQRVVRPLQRHLDRTNPMVDARLPDGSRVHIVMPPAAINGTTMTVRKFPAEPLTVKDLVRFGSFTDDVARFLQACIVSRMNVVVSGGTGSGKTTLLNVLSSFIPEDERIVTIEDAAELQLTQRHVVSLETVPPVQGRDGIEGRLVIRDLVRGALRMRPDRIVVGECRAGEALDMLQAMNTGHDGSLTTVHANNPRDCLSRLETLSLMAGVDLPITVIRRQISSAVNLIIQQSRLKDGSRKVVQITEIEGMQGDLVTLQDLFIYRTPGYSGTGYSHMGGGQLDSTGLRPNFLHKLEEFGFQFPTRMFSVAR
jgi:pilus assembly protein CpaF